ncbi:MAG: DNA repair protein RecO [Candidatus Saccharimonadales bacterium]
MKQTVTRAIVLRRTDYGEADRILTLLTPDQGKLSLLAKGVRRVKSKLAGGIELFSTSDITFIRGRGEVGTLVSARLEKHYANIVQDLDRTMLGYELIKMLHKNTEDEPESSYFSLLEQAFEALNDPVVAPDLARLWFFAQLLRLSGHEPNLQLDTQGYRLQADKMYDFSFEQVAFAPSEHGRFGAGHIKFLRLAVSPYSAKTLSQVQGSTEFLAAIAPLVHTMRTTFLRV